MKHHTSCITRHTSHIAYEFVCFRKFYKILHIKIWDAFKNSLKIILNEFTKYFDYNDLINNTNGYVKPKICQTKHLKQKLNFKEMTPDKLTIFWKLQSPHWQYKGIGLFQKLLHLTFHGEEKNHFPK